MRQLPRTIWLPVLWSAVLSLAVFSSQPHPARALYESGTYQIRSPLASTKWVTSPPRYHNGTNCPTDLVDSPEFDDITQCVWAAIPPGGSAPDWAMDIAGDYPNTVYIDIDPSAQGGYSAGSTYRVVAGPTFTWNSDSNGQYQYFNIKTWNPTTSSWEQFAWIRLGHITPTYANGTVLVSSATGHSVVSVGTVALGGDTWPAHVHMDMYNESYWSRSYNWDGPSAAEDFEPPAPPCVRSGGSASNCNTELRSVDGVGWVGGRATSYATVDNPYYIEF